jgi:hypothetical protein
MKKVFSWITKPVVWVTALIVFVIGGIIALVFKSKKDDE